MSIDTLHDIREIISSVEGFEGRVYRRWPKDVVAMPSCLISRVSATPTITDADGEEIAVSEAYSVDINSRDADTTDGLADEVIDALARFNFHRSGDTDFYDDTNRAYRRILTFTGTVDKRGNTFTGGF